MNKELDDKLCAKYPKIFADRHTDMKSTAMCWGFECGNGWYILIDKLCSHLQWNTDNNNKDYIMKNKLLRKLIPFLINLLHKIPSKYNLNKNKQLKLLVKLRGFLVGILSEWRSKQEFIYIESDRYPQVIATQVKEKFGGLRFYERGCNEDYQAISFAESLSYHICEKCGSMKDVGRTNGWIYTRCKKCAIKENLINETDFSWKSHEQLEQKNTEENET